MENVWLNVSLEVTAQDVTKVMHVSERTVYRYAERFRVTAWGCSTVGQEKRSCSTACCVILKSYILLIQLVLPHPGIYLRELQQLLYHSTSRCYNLQNSASARNDTAAHKACVFAKV